MLKRRKHGSSEIDLTEERNVVCVVRRRTGLAGPSGENHAIEVMGVSTGNDRVRNRRVCSRGGDDSCHVQGSLDIKSIFVAEKVF